MNYLFLNSDSDDNNDVCSCDKSDHDKIASGIFNYTVSGYNSTASKHNKDTSTNQKKLQYW